MDNLTHTLTGLMLSRAGLNRASPYATLTLLLSANAPDCDAVSLLVSPQTYFEYHRWITHSLFAIPAIAALVLFAVVGIRWAYKVSGWKPRALRFFDTGAGWVKLFAVAVIGVASHLALDYTNPYGIRLLVPWSNTWYALDITQVVDIWIWAVLLVAALAPWLSKLVSSEIGARKTAGRGWAVFALLFVIAYNCGRYVLASRVVTVQDSRVYNGLAPRRVIVFPSPMNPFLWRGAVETDEFWVVQNVNLLQDFNPTSGRVYYKPEPSPAIDAAKATRPFQDLLSFSKGVAWRVTPSPQPQGGTVVKAMDVRFGDPVGTAFVATAVLNPADQVERAWFSFSSSER